MSDYLLPEVQNEQERKRKAALQRRLANLRPFKPGQSGNPSGRKPGGAVVLEYINAFLAVDDDGVPRYTQNEIQAVIDNESAPPAAVAAARQVLLMMADPEKFVLDRRGKAHRAGHDPEPGRALERILDRILGKPTQTIIHEEPPADEADLLNQLNALLADNPDVARHMAKQVPNLAELTGSERPKLPE